LELNVDVIHCNDWQTGLVPAYLKLLYRNLPRYQRISTLYTIHNMAFQGAFWHWDMLLTGLDWKHFNLHEMEFYGKLNLLKTGLVFCDAINTVSPRYAKEIQTSEFGWGLESLLLHRRDALSGILNGIDSQIWNPATDRFLTANYDVDSVRQNKPICKAALQEKLGLPQLDDSPLVGIIGRLADQKGLDMVAQIVPDWVQNSNVQWAVLGTGDLQYEELFDKFNDRYPDKFAARLEFSDELAHMIEAGADMFLMPSRYEPCGLNQMYSLTYGTVPVVRETGGLADTVTDANQQTLDNGTANGFSFREDSSQALGETLGRACEAYGQPDVWNQLVSTGMRQDWSWARSAGEYVDLYERIVAPPK
jgi:starch synthase